MMELKQTLNQPKDENAFYPQEIYDVLNNPFMGWVPWAMNGPVSQPTGWSTRNQLAGAGA